MTMAGSLRKITLAVIAAAGLLTTSCEKVDNHRLPPASVGINFNTIGDWQLFGVSGAGQTREFIRQEGKPAGYPYKAGENTGFGGILLVCDPNGEYLAYDLACPVEAKPEIRVQYDTSSEIAGIVRCPKCGSTYNLYANGTPASGEALKLKYGLEAYRVFVGSTVPPYAYIRR